MSVSTTRTRLTLTFLILISSLTLTFIAAGAHVPPPSSEHSEAMNAVPSDAAVISEEGKGLTPTPVPTPCTRINVAASANGGTASASSTYNTNFPATATNNGDRTGNGWAAGIGGWNDGTANQFPDSLEINFGTARIIDEVIVYTIQDNYNNPIEPTEATSFSLYGITNFEVQYWNGSSWSTVPAGTITGNSHVKRKLTFASINTDRIRVVVNDTADHSYSRIVEVEAFGCPEADPTPTPTPVPGNGKIAFESNRDGNFEIYVMSPDGTNPNRVTNNTPVIDNLAPIR